MGETPQDIAKSILNFESSFSYQQISELQQLVDKHSVNHHAYPVVHFYRQSGKKDSLSLNIARLDEAITILLYSGKGNNYKEELKLLRSSMSGFLDEMERNFASNLSLEKIMAGSYDFPALDSKEAAKELRKRRGIIEGLFRSENFTWEDVFAKG